MLHIHIILNLINEKHKDKLYSFKCWMDVAVNMLWCSSSMIKNNKNEWKYEKNYELPACSYSKLKYAMVSLLLLFFFKYYLYAFMTIKKTYSTLILHFYIYVNSLVKSQSRFRAVAFFFFAFSLRSYNINCYSYTFPAIK